MYGEYKEFIIGRQFSGALVYLVKEIKEAIVDEEIGVSKLGEFHNVAGLVMLEGFGHIDFNVGIDIEVDGEIDMDVILEEKAVEDNIVNVLLHKISRRNMELIDNGHIKASQAIMLDSNIKAIYTLAYS